MLSTVWVGLDACSSPPTVANFDANPITNYLILDPTGAISDANPITNSVSLQHATGFLLRPVAILHISIGIAEAASKTKKKNKRKNSAQEAEEEEAQEDEQPRRQNCSRQLSGRQGK